MLLKREFQPIYNGMCIFPLCSIEIWSAKGFEHNFKYLGLNNRYTYPTQLISIHTTQSNYRTIKLTISTQQINFSSVSTLISSPCRVNCGPPKSAHLSAVSKNFHITQFRYCTLLTTIRVTRAPHTDCLLHLLNFHLTKNLYVEKPPLLVRWVGFSFRTYKPRATTPSFSNLLPPVSLFSTRCQQQFVSIATFLILECERL